MRPGICAHRPARTPRSPLQIRHQSAIHRWQTSAHEQEGFLPPAERRHAFERGIRVGLTAGIKSFTRNPTQLSGGRHIFVRVCHPDAALMCLGFCSSGAVFATPC